MMYVRCTYCTSIYNVIQYYIIQICSVYRIPVERPDNNPKRYTNNNNINIVYAYYCITMRSRGASFQPVSVDLARP